jgi:hypothetical protein
MDLQELKKIIRVSVQTQIRESLRKRKLLPESFTEFNSLVENVLLDHGQTIEFEEVYSLWTNVFEDTRGLSGRAAIDEWNESLLENVRSMGFSDRISDALIKGLKK